MPHGTPDWGLVGPKSTTYGLDDLGEHAVRLGSPHLFDRRGDVLLLTDFHDGIGVFDWLGAGGGALCTLETGHSRLGPYAVGLLAGKADGGDCEINCFTSYPRESLLGIEATFAPIERIGWLQLEMEYYDPLDQCFPGVRIDFANNELQWWRGVGDWPWFAQGVIATGSTHALHTMKMVIDPTLQEYVRCIFAGVEYDLRGNGYRVLAAGLAPYCEWIIRYVGLLADNYQAYVDNVIITQNEPPYQG